MKHLILLLAIAFLINKTSAQTHEVPKFNGEIKLISVVPQARFLYHTEKGKVYALPQDGMRCLVPEVAFMEAERKNYKQSFPNIPIPNPYSIIKIIPDSIKQISIYKNTPHIFK